MLLKLPIIFIATYLIVSLLQFVASLDGIMYFFGLHWIFSIFAALLLLFIPAIGPLAGVYGAVQVWGWPVWAALLLFFWPYIMYGIMLSLGVTTSFFVWKNAFKPFNHKKNKYIEPEYTVKESPQEIKPFYIEKK